MGIERYAYRATIQRDVSEGTDDYGQPMKGDVQTVATEVPCYYWFRDENVNENNRDAVILETVVYAAFPFTEDVRSDDRVTVYDLNGDLKVDESKIEGDPARLKRYKRARMRRYHGTG